MEAKNTNQYLKKKSKVKVRDKEKSKKRKSGPPKNSLKGMVITLSFVTKISCLNIGSNIVKRVICSFLNIIISGSVEGYMTMRISLGRS